jgi:pilus assembly protein CpaB
MRRPVYSVLLGVLFAAVAFYFVYNLRSAGPAEAAVAATPTTFVLVAADDIPFGARIIPEMIRQTRWPDDVLPADIVNDRKELLEGPDGQRIAIRSFAKGEPFLRQKISGYGEKPTLSRKVAEDMRAFSIRIGDVSGVAGFLLPGDRVDVVLTRQIGNDRSNLVSDVILQSITVLGIDQLASEETEDPVVAKTATVEVTPEQAQKLALAQQVGTLSLTLRNFADIANAEVKRVSVSDLGDARRKTAPQDTGTYVRVRKGSEVSRERVPH